MGERFDVIAVDPPWSYGSKPDARTARYATQLAGHQYDVVGSDNGTEVNRRTGAGIENIAALVPITRSDANARCAPMPAAVEAETMPGNARAKDKGRQLKSCTGKMPVAPYFSVPQAEEFWSFRRPATAADFPAE